jgi:3-hydroxybutyryl-CoA dehydrogenase
MKEIKPVNKLITGVVGAGVMGTGVAQSLAQAGHQVLLIDVSEDILMRARENIINSIRFQKLWHQGVQKEVNEVLELITFTSDIALLEPAQFVIENVTEKWEVKQTIYTQLDAVCSSACIFAANTSAISITRLASQTKRPDKVIGMHFMNPVPMKPMVEVIRGYHTSETTLAIARGLLASMGKDCIVVNDMPGFVSNRVLMLTVNEAIFLIQDQVATAEEVDRIFKTCFGHPMGPLETGDLIGLDTILYSLEVLYESYNDSKYRACPLLKKMVDAGLYGRKSGQGFYRYQ